MMTDDERYCRFVLETVSGFLAGLLACGLVSLLVGCTTVRYVPEIHYRDSVRVVHQHDTLLMQDSVCVYQYAVGETVHQDRYKARYIYKYVDRADTVRLTVRDTIAARGNATAWKRQERWYSGLVRTAIGIAALVALTVFAAWWKRKSTND